ncbi:MAG: PEP-CTERM sorting domain-containing protein [Gammaproteobacteria bacterium]|nr:PEP-CTERM sorting domain-containing protein [Gammaproteobacteria bacterium]
MDHWNRYHWNRLGITAALACAVLLTPAHAATARPVLDPGVTTPDTGCSGACLEGDALKVATSGVVWAEFLGGDADFFDRLYLYVGGQVQRPVFPNHPKPSQTVALGHFDAGTEIFLRLDGDGTRHDFRTGPVETESRGQGRGDKPAAPQVYATTVGFETSPDGRGKDFDDFRVRLTNVVDLATFASLDGASEQAPQRGAATAGNTNAEPSQSVPEPAALTLLAAGLIALAATRRRVRRPSHFM